MNLCQIKVIKLIEVTKEVRVDRKESQTDFCASQHFEIKETRRHP